VKDRLNIPITTAITIATILLSVGGSYAIIKSKTEKIDKVEEKTNENEKKMIRVETKLDGIDDALQEQKEVMKETRQDLKLILQAIMKENR
jgi:CBS-domain-containing membrane protein